MKKETNQPTPVEGSLEALQAEVERLRMENAYLKKLNALVQDKQIFIRFYNGDRARKLNKLTPIEYRHQLVAKAIKDALNGDHTPQEALNTATDKITIAINKYNQTVK